VYLPFSRPAASRRLGIHFTGDAQYNGMISFNEASFIAVMSSLALDVCFSSTYVSCSSTSFQLDSCLGCLRASQELNSILFC